MTTAGDPPNPAPGLWLGNALMKMATAQTNAGLWAQLKEVAARYGCSELTAVDALKSAGGTVDAVLIADSSVLAILSLIDREGLAKTHPVLERCLTSSEPFKLTELRDDPSSAGQRWSELLSDVAMRGDVLIVPIYDGEELTAIFAFGGERPTLDSRSSVILQIAAYATFVRVRAIDPHAHEANPYNLTVREMQCLRWMAFGKTDSEIGQILGISARTVRFHCENAKRKLGVATRAQAVATSVNEKLIVI
jgi:LuxR family quorum sensing-dependent transcriptional regulator